MLKNHWYVVMSATLPSSATSFTPAVARIPRRHTIYDALWEQPTTGEK